MSESTNDKRGLAGLLQRQPWIVFVVPFVVFMVLTQLEPTPDKSGGALGFSIPYAGYPWVYSVKIALTVLAVALVWSGYRRFAFRVSPLAVLVGVVGVVVWVGVCKLQIETRFLGPLVDNAVGRAFGLDELFNPSRTRSGYNPLEQLAAHPAAAWGFLAIRFLGLAAVVPVIEEFFLRGFLMRFVMARDWWEVPFGKVDATAVVVGTVFPMLMHPAELVAAAVWFSMITWLMVRTRNVWDCVAAHTVTNLLLGIYVVTTGDWYFM
ncbi:MAG TPA: CAAX prenyl protease-related protein [Thermoguttaceae bacterium]|nr:CAAX prenyl protease-related protein [Thermoguttaceae bacterium]